MRPIPVLLLLPLVACASPVASPEAASFQPAALRHAPQRAPRIEITNLGTLGGGSSRAVDINKDGQIVGSAATSGGKTHAFLWQNGTMTDLGTLGGDWSDAAGINDDGRIAGSSGLVPGVSCPWPGGPVSGCRAWYWDGTMHDLGTLGGAYSAARGITPKGHVFGVSTTASGETHAFLWDGRTMRDLGTLGGSPTFPANGNVAANAAGGIVGTSRVSSGDPHAVAWQRGRRIDLGTLGGTTSQAFAVNARGWVVGMSYTTTTDPSGNRHAFLWDGRSMRDLGTLGGDDSEARAINARGWVVGYAHTSAGGIGSPHPFLWDGKTMRDLGTLGGADGDAFAINGKGEVVGQAALATDGMTCTGIGGCHPFYWDGKTMHDLGSLGFPMGNAVDLNERGQIVGWALQPDRSARAVLWTVKR